MTNNHCHEDQHTAACIERAVDQIRENNEATALLEPGRELAAETEDEAREWLANGNAACWTAGDCNCDAAEIAKDEPETPKRMQVRVESAERLIFDAIVEAYGVSDNMAARFGPLSPLAVEYHARAQGLVSALYFLTNEPHKTIRERGAAKARERSAANADDAAEQS